MTCPLCHSGNRDSNGHINSFKHRKALIKLFKKFNKKKENMPFEKWDSIYEETLQQFINTTILNKIIN